MKFTYGNQTVDLFDEQNFPEGLPEKAVVSLSGGCDSSSLVYLIGKYLPEMKIYPFHMSDEDGRIDTEKAKNVHKFLQDTFPNSVQDLKIYEVKTSDPVWQEKAKKMFNDPKGGFIKNEKTGEMVRTWGTINGCSKAMQNRAARSEMSNTHNTPAISAMTTNPPVEVQKERGFYEVAERKRDPGNGEKQLTENWPDGGHTYAPYLRVDKKFVAGVFKEHNLMETLYPLTKSCAWSTTEETCGECFWCNEKDWAFED